MPRTVRGALLQATWTGDKESMIQKHEQAAHEASKQGAHVMLFAKWTNAEKTHALFYEASPFSKTVASERDVNQMTSVGFKPLRYRHIRD